VFTQHSLLKNKCNVKSTQLAIRFHHVTYVLKLTLDGTSVTQLVRFVGA